MQIVPIRDLKDTVAIEKLCATGPVIVTKNGYGRLVVMDIEKYKESEREKETLRHAMLVNESIMDLRNGVKPIPGDEFKKRTKEKYGYDI